MKLTTLIADDEPLARERLRSLLAAHSEVDITTECRNGREVIAALKAAPIDLVFLDIQMPGNTGFEVIDQIGPANMPITVFVTAHNAFAVKAFELHALDYLTKPLEPARLAATLIRIQQKIAANTALATQSTFNELIETFRHTTPPQGHYPQRILVPNGAKDILINIAEIEWIEASDYYTCLHVGNKRLMLRQSIKQLIATLDPAKFIRIHRSAIVNLDHIREILKEGRTGEWIVLANGHRIKLSKTGTQTLTRLFHPKLLI